uniref:Uncharacterized protein n=1 Tax=Setaria digitata TaxID=48799 RepID=A0A915PL28_9BILA
MAAENDDAHGKMTLKWIALTDDKNRNCKRIQKRYRLNDRKRLCVILHVNKVNCKRGLIGFEENG